MFLESINFDFFRFEGEQNAVFRIGSNERTLEYYRYLKNKLFGIFLSHTTISMKNEKKKQFKQKSFKCPH